MDYGHEQAEKALKKLEKRLNKEYTQAAKEVEKKLRNHLKKYEEKDRKMADRVKAGELSEKEYLQWRTGQMAMGERWEKLRDELVETYQDTNKVATDMIQDHTHQVYADNFNFGTFEVEKGSKINTSFTLYSKDTVARLVKDNPKLLPPPSHKVSQAIREGKAKRWNQQKVQSVMTQGILQGESIPKIAKRLAITVGEQNMHSAIRNARTMTTSAENAGRIDSYKRAQGMGIEVKKQWLATLDGRTRHSHRLLDGESVGIDEKFSNGLMFPADPDGAPEEVYNCRCTLIADIAGFGDDFDDNYESWEEEHEEIKERGLEDIISGTGNVTIEEASEDWFEYENANMMSEYIRTGKMPKENMYEQVISDKDRERLIYDANLIQEVGAKTNTKQKTLYRGMVMSEDEARALTPNDTYTLETLTATTPDRKIASIYMDVENIGMEDGVPVIFEIQKPDGIFGFKRDDLETVLPKGSSFRIERNYMDKDGVVHISLYAKKGKNNVIADAEEGIKELKSKISTVAKPVIGDTLKFTDERAVAKYFRGDVYDSKIKKSGYGIRDKDDRPATRWKNKLTFAQEQCISDYTGDSYEPINNFLRGLITEKEAKEELSGGEFGLKSLVKNIDAGINKFKLDAPITVYRTCEREFLDQLSVGGVFHDDGYGSTSVLPLPVASGDVHFEIAVPSGKGIGAYVDAVSWKEGEEFEFLLGRGADYYVESIEERKDGVYVKASIAGFTREK